MKSMSSGIKTPAFAAVPRGMIRVGPIQGLPRLLAARGVGGACLGMHHLDVGRIDHRLGEGEVDHFGGEGGEVGTLASEVAREVALIAAENPDVSSHEPEVTTAKRVRGPELSEWPIYG